MQTFKRYNALVAAISMATQTLAGNSILLREQVTALVNDPMYASRGKGGKHRANSANPKHNFSKNGKPHQGAQEVARRCGVAAQRVPCRLWRVVGDSGEILFAAKTRRLAQKYIDRVDRPTWMSTYFTTKLI